MAARLGLAWWRRPDTGTVLMLVLAANAAVLAVRNPHIESLYRLLPDREVARTQAREGSLAATLLPEFGRRLAGPDGNKLAELTVASWLKRRHAISPVACTQQIDSGRQLRVGFRRLAPPSAPIEGAMEFTRLKLRITHGDETLLDAELRDIMTAGANLAAGQFARDIALKELSEPPQIIVEQVVRTAAGLSDTLGPVKPITSATRGLAASRTDTVELRVKRFWVLDAGYAVVVSGAPAGEPGSDAYDVVVPWYNGGQRHLRFLGWEWLASGVHSFVDGAPTEADIEVVIRH